MSSSYQSCRWYDPYPRLAFALKLLYLAPATMQAHAAHQLRDYLLEHWGAASSAVSTFAAGKGKRWYDEDPNTAAVVELLRESPPRLKTLAADELLDILCPLGNSKP